MSEVIVGLDTFHFLVDRLEITPESRKLESEFKQFAELPGNEDKGWLELMEDFAKKYDNESITVNTYNGEDAVNQTLQYTAFDKDGSSFVLLQIHGGADVRGGYTEPYVFEMDEKTSLMDNADLSATTGEGENIKYWYSDDAGYDWYYEGSTAEPEDKKDQGRDGGIPENWEVTENGVYYRPTGELIDFGNGGIFNGEKAPLRMPRRQKTGTYRDLRYVPPSKSQKALELQAIEPQHKTAEKAIRKHVRVSLPLARKRPAAIVLPNSAPLTKEEVKEIAGEDQEQEQREEKERLKA